MSHLAVWVTAWFVTIMNCLASNIALAFNFWVAKTQDLNTTPLQHIIFLQCSAYCLLYLSWMQFFPIDSMKNKRQHENSLLTRISLQFLCSILTKMLTFISNVWCTFSQFMVLFHIPIIQRIVEVCWLEKGLLDIGM